MRDEALFTNRVISALNALGYRAQRETLVAGTRFDLLCEIDAPAVGRLRVAVECKYRTHENVSRRDVAKFVEDLSVSGEQIDLGLMVTNTGYSPTARSIGERHKRRLRLTTLDDLHRDLLDPTPGLVRLVAEYTGSRAETNFVALRAKVSRGSGTVREDADAVSFLSELMLGPEHALAIVLGDFGAGKTTLMERLRIELARVYLEERRNGIRRAPVMVRLRDYSKLPSLALLLGKALRDQFGREVPIELFWERRDDGGLAFLLDGFDEMVGRADPAERKRLLLLLNPLLTGPSPAVLTCRPGYFVQTGEYDAVVAKLRRHSDRAAREVDRRTGAVGAKAEAARLLRSRLRSSRSPTEAVHLQTLPSLRTLELLPFGKAEILEFVSRAGTGVLERHSTSPEAVYDFLESVYDLRDLAKRPILLEMLVETIEHGSIDLADRSIDIGPAQLYEEYTSMKLEWDWAKGESRQGLLTPAQRRRASTLIAERLLSDRRSDLTLVEMLTLLRREFISDGTADDDPTSLAELVTDVATCAFITRSGDDAFRFTHQSFAEFFVGRDLAMDLLEERDRYRIADRLYAAEVLYFVGGFAFFNAVVRNRLWRLMSAPGASEELRTNVVAALLNSGRELRDLRVSAVTLRGLRLRDVSIFGGKIARTRFIGSELRDCRFGNIALEDVSFEECELSSVEMTQPGRVAVSLIGCRCVGLTIQSPASLSTTSAVADGQVVGYADVDIAAIDSDMRDLRAEESAVCLIAEGRGRILEVKASNSYLRLTAPQESSRGVGRRLEEFDATGCFVDLVGYWDVRNARIADSVVVVRPQNAIQLRSCAIVDSIVVVIERVQDARSDLTGTTVRGASVIAGCEPGAEVTDLQIDPNAVILAVASDADTEEPSKAGVPGLLLDEQAYSAALEAGPLSRTSLIQLEGGAIQAGEVQRAIGDVRGWLDGVLGAARAGAEADPDLSR